MPAEAALADIEIDGADLAAHPRQRNGDMNGGSRLPRPALLIPKNNNVRHPVALLDSTIHLSPSPLVGEGGSFAHKCERDGRGLRRSPFSHPSHVRRTTASPTRGE